MQAAGANIILLYYPFWYDGSGDDLDFYLETCIVNVICGACVCNSTAITRIIKLNELRRATV